MHTYARTHVHTYIHTYMYIHTYIHTHTKRSVLFKSCGITCDKMLAHAHMRTCTLSLGQEDLLRLFATRKALILLFNNWQQHAHYIMCYTTCSVDQLFRCRYLAGLSSNLISKPLGLFFPSVLYPLIKMCLRCFINK